MRLWRCARWPYDMAISLVGLLAFAAAVVFAEAVFRLYEIAVLIRLIKPLRSAYR